MATVLGKNYYTRRSRAVFPARHCESEVTDATVDATGTVALGRLPGRRRAYDADDHEEALKKLEAEVALVQVQEARYFGAERAVCARQVTAVDDAASDRD